MNNMEALRIGQAIFERAPDLGACYDCQADDCEGCQEEDE